MAYTESMYCNAHAERAIRKRRQAQEESGWERGNARLAAMLAEGELIESALGHLNLSYYERLDYIEQNSVFVKALDGHEAIQLIWADNKVICIHRLLSKEFRSEFQAHWLGVWSELNEGRSKELIIESFRQKIEHRECLRESVGINCEIQFAASPAVVLASFNVKH